MTPRIKVKPKKRVKAWAVLHDEYNEIRFWGGEAVISTEKKDLLSHVSKQRGGTGEAINPLLGLYSITITYTSIIPKKKAK